MKWIFQPGRGQQSAKLGGKAHALAVLHGTRGVKIPEWIALLPEALEVSLANRIRQGACAEPVGDGLDDVPAWLAPDPRVMRELNEVLAQLCPRGETVAVRSSAPDEDGSDHSFAGQLESFLFVAPATVPEKVVAVWRSAFSVRVGAYRKQRQLFAGSRPPAVIIQRMVKANVAGVAFSADPVTGDCTVAVVSAVKGSGASLVNGESDADTWSVDHENRIMARRIAAHHPVLNAAQVRAVAALARRSEEIFGRPQDVEWAIADGNLYLLQSRPITSLGSDSLRPEKLKIWDNSNIIESYSGVTTPLTFSFARRAYEGVYREFCRLLAVPRAKIAAHDDTFRHMLGLIRGRVYYNLLNWYRVLALLPGFTINRRFMEQMMGVKEELPEEIANELARARISDRLKDGFYFLFSVAALMGNHLFLRRKIRRFNARLTEALAPPEKPLEAMTMHELCAYFFDLESKLVTRWDAPLLNDFFAMIFYGVLRRLVAKWVNDSGDTLQNDLLCGGGGMISAEPARRVREMARIAASDEVFAKQLCSAPLPAILSAMERVPEFRAAFLDYLEKFGDRCLEELKLESLTLHDDPLMLLRSVGRVANSKPSAMPITEAASTGRSSTADRVTAALGGHLLERILFAWVLRHARARVRDRENLRFERTRLFGRVRRIFVELGRRLHAHGDLQDPRDVFFLEIDELFGFVASAGTRPALTELVAVRQEEFTDYRASEPPPSRFTTHGTLNDPTHWSDLQVSGPAGDSSQRKGIGCCPGIVRGRVCKIVDPRHATIRSGEILVAERTDPGWIMLFPSAAGLLVERGSVLSHSAIVSRELRIPSIVSIDGLTAWLGDGDWVEFDGSTGIVRKIESHVADAGAGETSMKWNDLNSMNAKAELSADVPS